MRQHQVVVTEKPTASGGVLEMDMDLSFDCDHAAPTATVLERPTSIGVRINLADQPEGRVTDFRRDLAIIAIPDQHRCRANIKDG